MHPHDLDLPAWGPYGKRYAGCSHIPDPTAGCRLDVSVFPAWEGGRVDIPNVAWDSGYAPWQAAADGSYHAFRHQLLGRDELTLETSYAAAGDGGSGRVVRVLLANRTARAHSLCAHLVLGCQYPSPRPTGHSAPQIARPAILVLPGGGAWVDARDSDTHTAGTPQAADHLVPDGWNWHETLEDGCVGGGFRWFGPGDAATWRLHGETGCRLWLRLRSGGHERARISVAGAEHAVDGQAWRWLELPWDGGAAVALRCLAGMCHVDVLALAPAGTTPQLAERRWQPVPRIAAGPRPDCLRLAWPDLAASYGLWWGGQAFVRQWFSESLDEPMRRGAHNHVSPVLHGPGEGHWLTVRLGPFHLAPGAQAEAFAFVCEGDASTVDARLSGLDLAVLRGWHDAAAARAWRPRSQDVAGRAAQLMSASLATNIVYPVYTRRGYIRHHSPGKAWDSLYTWDNGFIALGLAELDARRAAGCVAQYLMPDGDGERAWLHHGTPLPVQIHVARELWNRTRDPVLAARLYPGLRRMHRFLVGRAPGSATRRPSGLLSTWQHFYNSGGWDDYPAQVQMHAQGLAARTAPMVNTCQAIMTARILRELAVIVGQSGDVAEYDADIAELGAAVQAHAWDEAEGFFGYVLHDEAGRPQGLLRHGSGANANRGLDGCYPLFAGICDAVQERLLLGHLADPRRLWTPHGLSTVDQSAPNYRHDGYWNGAVWLPHNWFAWKALLDLGQGELAWRLVDGALASWSAACADAERTWEKMIISTGCGTGWHHFGGLSSPLLAWYEALHCPGRLSGGAGLWIHAEESGQTGYRARLCLTGRDGRRSAAWLCLPGHVVRATWNGGELGVQRRGDRVWELDLPARGAGDLDVQMC